MAINKAELVDYYRTMVMIRKFETIAGELFTATRIPGFIHLSIGQEASSVGVCSCLRRDDYITTTHRGHGHMIAKGADIKKMMAELFGRKDGYCKGKGGSMHIADFSLGILGANGVVAGGVPIAIGAGFSIKMRKTEQVTVCFFGDGASNRGPVHESMNMASIFNLPVIFVVENNCYASTTPQSYASSVNDISMRAAGYAMPGVTVDGNDIFAVREAAAKAVERARRGEGPSLLENKTYRIRGHFEGDPQRYRSPDEVEKWKRENDPIERFADYLREKKILDDKKMRAIAMKVDNELDVAIQLAEKNDYPEKEEALKDIFSQ